MSLSQIQEKNNAPLDEMQRHFFRRLFDGLDGLIEFRPIEDKPGGRVHHSARRWFSLGELLPNIDTIIEFCRKKRLGAFFGVAPRNAPGKGGKESISMGRAVWADLDSKHYPSSEAMYRKLDGLEHKPDCIIRTKNGFHIYYFLNEEETAEDIERVNFALAEIVGADHCGNIDRVLRIPGSWHQKDISCPFLCEITHFNMDDQGWNLIDLADSWNAKELKEKIDIEIDVSCSIPDISDRLKRLFFKHENLNNYFAGIGKPAGLDDSGSGYDYSFARECFFVDRNIPDQDVANAVAERMKRRGKRILMKSIIGLIKKVKADLGLKIVQGDPAEITTKTPEKIIDRVPLEKLMLYPEDHRYKYLRGLPKANLTNAVQILSKDAFWNEQIKFNDFKSQLEIRNKGITKVLNTEIRLWFTENYDMELKAQEVDDAVQYVAHESRYHPVREYLIKCKKYVENIDPKEKNELLENWILHFCNPVFDKNNESLIKAISKKFLISAARRIMNPGCEVHNILVLIGEQGAGKSRLCQTLAHDKSWYSNTNLDVKGDRDTFSKLKGVWLYEFPELIQTRGRSKDNESVKAFLSKSSDHYRSVWAHYDEEVPRQCVFIGTTNEIEILSDPTGARRFWTIETGDIDIEKLREKVDVLWGLAMLELDKKTPHFLNKEEAEKLEKHQQKYRSIDTWIFEIERLEKCDEDGVISRMTIPKILERFHIPIERQNKSVQMRVASALKSAKWKKVRDGDQYYWEPPINQ